MRQRVRQVLSEFPLLAAIARKLRNAMRPSVAPAYRPIGAVQTESAVLRAWQQEALPLRQADVVESELRQLWAGSPPKVFACLANALRGLVRSDGTSTLLEIGCSSAHYHDVLRHLSVPHQYSGCDISEHFIRSARTRHPGLPLFVGDATAMPCPDASFDIVVSGCCLLHIRDYPRAVAEAARISRNWVVFHRTPILQKSPTQEFIKDAYGVKMLEIHFNEDQLLRTFARFGLAVVATDCIHSEKRGSDTFEVKTYTCSKVSV